MLGPSSNVSATHLCFLEPWKTVCRPKPAQPTRCTGSILVVALPSEGARSVHVASARRSERGDPQAGPYQLLCAAKLSFPGFRPSAPRLKSREMLRRARLTLAEIEPAPRIDFLPTTDTPTSIRSFLTRPAGQRNRRPIDF